jgi:outer membrane murein-binding lipoprotein Lpp
MVINKFAIKMTKNHNVFVILSFIRSKKVNRFSEIEKHVIDLPCADAKIRNIRWKSYFSNKYVKIFSSHFQFIVVVIRFGVIFKNVIVSINVITATILTQISDRVKKILKYLYLIVLKLFAYCLIFLYIVAHFYFPLTAHCVPPPSPTFNVAIAREHRRDVQLKSTLTASPIRTPVLPIKTYEVQVREFERGKALAEETLTKIVHHYPFMPFIVSQPNPNGANVDKIQFFRPIRYRMDNDDTPIKIKIIRANANTPEDQNRNPRVIDQQDIDVINRRPAWLVATTTRYTTVQVLESKRLTTLIPSDSIKKNEHLRSITLLGVVYDIDNINMRVLLYDQLVYQRPSNDYRFMDLLNTRGRSIMFIQCEYQRYHPNNQRNRWNRIVNYLPNQVQNLGNIFGTAVVKKLTIFAVVSSVVLVGGGIIFHTITYNHPSEYEGLKQAVQEMGQTMKRLETKVDTLVEAQRNEAINKVISGGGETRGTG